MLFLYDLLLSLYAFVIRVYSLFNPKAKQWIEGRKNWQQKVATALQPNERRIWIHCSSMGEFEQAKPVIEELKITYPAYKIVVTFFSPSGYEACKNDKCIDYAFYLPHDSKRNAALFIKAIQPSIALFVKYEFWYHYLKQLKANNIPTLLVSGAFREGQVFFKGHGGLFREMLSCFTYFFLQDEQSKKLLHTINISDNVAVSGDTRYDRVSVIANNIKPIPDIEQFKGDHKILIAGSTWPGDEEVLKECLAILPNDWKLVLVPHEIDEPHIKKIQQLFDQSILFTELSADPSGNNKKVLIVNNMGTLSRLYAYGDVAFIGGGFQKGGIHNILEPAIFGLPVIFGPIYEKFVEAKELASLKYVFPVNDAEGCKAILKKLVNDESYRNEISASIKAFMQEHIGATGRIVDKIAIEKWLN